MILETLVVGSIGANCYIVGCERTKAALVIDPGGDGDKILRRVDELGLSVELVINTHGHLDHIAENRYLKQNTGAKLAIHKDDAQMLIDPEKNLSALFDPDHLVTSSSADILFSDGDKADLGDYAFQVLHTPGHTAGGICLKFDNAVFTGDTLFAGSIGRTDFPGGSYNEILNSIRTKLCPLDDDFVIYPGHGPATTLGYEKRRNPYIVSFEL
jgi:hydroxyacylglutathione hydrolase